MTKNIVIKTVDESPLVPFPQLNGLKSVGDVNSRSVIASDTALLLWIHELKPRASIEFVQPKCGHLLYVWRGDVNVNEVKVSEAQVFIVEHLADAIVTAGDQGATIVHFHQAENQPLLTAKVGGHVHISPKEGLFSRWDEARQARHTVWADADCQTCDFWLHRSAFGRPRLQSEPHFHNEDEIIFVIEGATIVGKEHPTGTAIAVPAGKTYAFGVAAQGSAFINFRATSPLVKMVDKGKASRDWMSERSFMRNEIELPVIDPRAALQ